MRRAGPKCATTAGRFSYGRVAGEIECLAQRQQLAQRLVADGSDLVEVNAAKTAAVAVRRLRRAFSTRNRRIASAATKK
jgi:hypothetical protein